MDRARIRVRRAALQDAVRAGDLAVAARAAARLRVHGVHLDDGELGVARRARRALGRAVHAARQRRIGESPRIIREPIPFRRRAIRWRRALVATLASAVVLGAIAILLASGLDLGGLSGDNAPAAPLGVAQVTEVSRGRSFAEIPIVVVAEPQPAAVPSPSATTAPSATGEPRPPGPPGPIVAKGGKVPLDLPGVLPGYVRMTVQVVDDGRSQPLENVCVIYGTLACGPEEPKTNSAGIWALDVPVTSNPIPWDLRFEHPGYRAQATRLTTRAQDVFVVIRLERQAS